MVCVDFVVLTGVTHSGFTNKLIVEASVLEVFDTPAALASMIATPTHIVGRLP